jgi:hypothetical protein
LDEQTASNCENVAKPLNFGIVGIEQIKEAIERLSLEERAEIAARLHGWKDNEWDEQMKRDVANGKLDNVLREVDGDIRAGRLRDMP